MRDDLFMAHKQTEIEVTDCNESVFLFNLIVGAVTANLRKRATLKVVTAFKCLHVWSKHSRIDCFQWAQGPKF